MVELFLFLFGVLLVGLASLEDIRFMRVSPELPFSLFVVEGVWAVFLGEGYRILPYVFILAVPMYGLWWVGKLGGGDVKLGVALAAVLAASRVELTFFMPFLLVCLLVWGAYWGLALRLRDGVWPDMVPAAPAMCLALMWAGLKLF